MFRSAVRGALMAMVGIFPVAALVALVYRFPVPFAGIVSGWNVVDDGLLAPVTAPVKALFAVVFYGILGGFPLLGLLGAIGGGISWGATQSHPEQLNRTILYASLGIDLVAALVLASLDLVIGQW